MNTTRTITKTDLDRIEASLKKAIDASKTGGFEKKYLDLLNQLADSLNKIRLTVEFDHEKRISAIEEYLQQL